jgi:hypothetical protein
MFKNEKQSRKPINKEKFKAIDDWEVESFRVEFENLVSFSV